MASSLVRGETAAVSPQLLAWGHGSWISHVSVTSAPHPHLAGAPPLVAAHPLATFAALVLGPDAPGLEVMP